MTEAEKQETLYWMELRLDRLRHNMAQAAGSGGGQSSVFLILADRHRDLQKRYDEIESITPVLP
jgi:hypothetical protein